MSGVTAPQHREQEQLQIREAAIHDHTVDPGAAGDGLHRQRSEALLGDERQRDVDQLLAALRPRHSGAGARRRYGSGRGGTRRQRGWRATMPRRVDRQQRDEIARDGPEPLGAPSAGMGEHQPRCILPRGHDQSCAERMVEAVRAAATRHAPVKELRDPLGEDPSAVNDSLAQLRGAAPGWHQHEAPRPRVRLHCAQERRHRID